MNIFFQYNCNFSARIDPGINVDFMKCIMKDLHTQYIISHSEEIKLGLSKRYSISARYVWKGD